MFNVGGGELMIILLVALLVLGPQKLPSAAKQFGKVMSDFKNMSAGFQREMREAMNDPVEAATKDRTKTADDGSGTASPEISTAEEAGMYEADPPAVDTSATSEQPDNEDES